MTTPTLTELERNAVILMSRNGRDLHALALCPTHHGRLHAKEVIRPTPTA